MVLYGVDVSHWNGDIDFDAFTNKEQTYNDFIIAKASQGNRFVDSSFKKNAFYASQFNILFGMYHFLDDKGCAREQTDNFLEQFRYTKEIGLEPLLALDVEEDGVKTLSDITVEEMVLYFVSEVYDKTGSYPLIYTSTFFRSPYFFDNFAPYCPGWIARYSSKSAKRKDLNLTIRQFTDAGRVKGIGGKVDLDKAYLTREGWFRIANPSKYA